MFRSLKNIDTAFKQIRMFTIIFVISVTTLCIYVVWDSRRLVEKSREKIYVLDQGKSLLLALSQNISQNRPVEARDHVKHFHELFFTLSPDTKSIKYNVEEALYLCDESAVREFRYLQGNDYYKDIIASNISQSIKINSVDINFDQYPYYAKTSAVQTLVSAGKVTERNLTTECWLKDVPRSENNPHGFLMMKWKVLDNRKIKEYDR